MQTNRTAQGRPFDGMVRALIKQGRTTMDREKTIDDLWERSNHGTRREDVVAAYEAGAASEREAWALRFEQTAAVMRNAQLGGIDGAANRWAAATYEDVAKQMRSNVRAKRV